MDRKQRVAGTAFAVACLAAPVAADEGALAYSPSTDEVSSGSSSFYTLRELQIKALESCSADDCRIVMTFRSGECVAIASSDKRYGVGKGKSQADADAGEMESCSDGGAEPNCRLFGQHCAKE